MLFAKYRNANILDIHIYKYTYIYLVYKKIGYSWEYQEYPLYPPMFLANAPFHEPFRILGRNQRIKCQTVKPCAFVPANLKQPKGGFTGYLVSLIH